MRNRAATTAAPSRPTSPGKQATPLSARPRRAYAALPTSVPRLLPPPPRAPQPWARAPMGPHRPMRSPPGSSPAPIRSAWPQRPGTPRSWLRARRPSVIAGSAARDSCRATRPGRSREKPPPATPAPRPAAAPAPWVAAWTSAAPSSCTATPRPRKRSTWISMATPPAARPGTATSAWPRSTPAPTTLTAM